MTNKYDWTNVPKHVNFIATDAFGVAMGWVQKPEPREIFGFWKPLSIDYVFDEEQNMYKGFWLESLEERPEEFK